MRNGVVNTITTLVFAGGATSVYLAGKAASAFVGMDLEMPSLFGEPTNLIGVLLASAFVGLTVNCVPDVLSIVDQNLYRRKLLSETIDDIQLEELPRQDFPLSTEN